MRHGTAARRGRILGVVAALAGLLSLGAGTASAEDTAPPGTLETSIGVLHSPTFAQGSEYATVVFDVHANAAPGVPTGTLRLTDTPASADEYGTPTGPAVEIAVLPLDADGKVTTSLGGLAVGRHRIGAQYSGDAVYSPTTTEVLVTVTEAGTPPPGPEDRAVPRLTWSMTPETPLADGPITLTVDVTGDAGVPTGIVQVGTWDDNDYFEERTLAGGTTSFVFDLPAGRHQLYIGYVGNSTYRGVSNGPSFDWITVAPRSAAAPVALTAPATISAAAAAPVRIPVAVATDGTRPPTAVVRVDGTQVGTVKVPGTGDLVVTVPGQPAGTHVVTVETAGTEAHEAASATTTLTVTTAPPALGTSEPTGTVASSSRAAVPGEQITVTASGYAPGEVVAFYLHSDPIYLGVAVADAQGVATLTVAVPTQAPAGQHHVRAIGGTSGVWAEVPVALAAAPGAAPAAAAPVAAGAPADTRAALAVTGASPTAALSVAGGLLALGAGLVLVGRARTVRATR
jgi:hypothetical protein